MNPTERFTETVQNYIRYRPPYPSAVLDLLISECKLSKAKIMADIGSGTGLLSQLFLNYGNTVYGVEPNQAMRAAAADCLRSYPYFHSVAGCAEATQLPDKTIDFITAGTAFHWFDPDKTKREFQRIGKANAWVVLVWNVRNTEASALVSDYEDLICKYGKDYTTSNASKMDKVVLKEFFAPHSMKTAAFKNSQQFDWLGLKGRLLSTSYSLRPGDLHYESMLDELKLIFERYQEAGKVAFLYETKVYYSPI
jgi:ubiquinone/menaquinone biosynthesis C-methylase UbiE